MKLVSTNPSKGYQVVGRITISSASDIRSKVQKARRAARAWKEIGLDARIAYLRKLASLFLKHKKVLAKIQTDEMGMRISESEDEIDGCAQFLTWYCDNAHEALDRYVTFENGHERHEVHHEPRGTLAVIVPWNYPFANFVWQCGQNLIAGNTIVFKHSEETPLCGKWIERLVREAGFPSGVFEEVYGDGRVGARLVEENVDGICFTGSTKTGQNLYVSGAKRLIPVHLELGGSSPGIVFDDADIEATVTAIYNYRFYGCGQQCKAIKRLIAHHSVAKEVTERLVQLMKTKRMGDAQNRDADVGPLVAERQVTLLEAQVRDAVTKGAKVLIGGRRPSDLKGAYYEPTILSNVTTNMRVWKEEVFGPVLPIVTFKTEAEALKLANDTLYGLGAFVFTNDGKRYDRIAAALESGMVSQNETNFVRACNPFGGYKRSGLGREHGKQGFLDATQVKVITRVL